LSVAAPPRTTDHEHDRELRVADLEALIEEARRRARRRRQRQGVAALLLAAAAGAAFIGFGGYGGGGAGTAAFADPAGASVQRDKPAGPLPCTVGTWSCLGWDGITSQVVPGMLNTETGSAITFATNHTETSVGDFQWAIGNEHCTLTGTTHVPINMGVGDPPERGHQVQAGTATVPIDMGWGVQTKPGWQTPVVAGHFSKTGTLTNPAFAKRHLPTTVVWHLTGTISGHKAHGTMRWAFTGPTKNACSPSSGSFTWHASIGGVTW
jgi:hypothetical protein